MRLRLTRNDLATYAGLSRVGSDIKHGMKDWAMADAASAAPETFTHQRPAGETTSGTEGMNYDSDTGQYLPKFMDGNKPTEQAQAQLNATPEAPAAMPEGKLPTFATETSTKYRLGDQEQDTPFSSDQVGMHRLRSMSDIALRSGNPVEAAQFDALAAKRREAADQTAIRDALTVPRGMAKVPTEPSSGMGGNGAATNEPQPAGAAAPGQGMRRQGGYLEAVTPRVTEAYLRQGKVSEAKAWRDFAESERGRAYSGEYVKAQQLINAGDFESVAPVLEGLYNNSYPDGRQAKITSQGNGNYKLDVIDQKSGQMVGTKVLAGPELGKLALGGLSPEKVVEFTVQQQAKRDAEAASLSKSIELERLRQQGQDVRDDRRDERLNRQLGAMDGRLSKQLEARERGGGLTLSQQRQNEEIEAAREAVAGLSPEEIRIRTTPALASGRDNPNYDPRLSTAAKAANRRKLGEDPYFDQRQGRQPGTESFAGKPLTEMTEQQLQQFGRAAGAEGKTKIGAEPARRTFAGDQALRGHQLGEMVPGKGYKVLDPQGRHVGYWGQR